MSRRALPNSKNRVRISLALGLWTNYFCTVLSHLEAMEIYGAYYSPGTKRFNLVCCSLRKDGESIRPSQWGNRLLIWKERYDVIKLFLSIPLLSQEGDYLIFFFPLLRLSREGDSIFFFAIYSGLPITFIIRKGNYKRLFPFAMKAHFIPRSPCRKSRFLVSTRPFSRDPC